jgi:hypothetical protein
MEPLPLGGPTIPATVIPIDGTSKLARLLQNVVKGCLGGRK